MVIKIKRMMMIFMFCSWDGIGGDPPPDDWHPRQGESRTNFLAASTSVNHHLMVMVIMMMMLMMFLKIIALMMRTTGISGYF